MLGESKHLSNLTVSMNLNELLKSQMGLNFKPIDFYK